ncbi:MAG: Uncharacterized DUF554 membrane protein, partial [uncultured Nocardioidaceae bacterium]
VPRHRDARQRRDRSRRGDPGRARGPPPPAADPGRRDRRARAGDAPHRCGDRRLGHRPRSGRRRRVERADPDRARLARHRWGGRLAARGRVRARAVRRVAAQQAAARRGRPAGPRAVRRGVRRELPALLRGSADDPRLAQRRSRAGSRPAVPQGGARRVRRDRVRGVVRVGRGGQRAGRARGPGVTDARRRAARRRAPGGARRRTGRHRRPAAGGRGDRAAPAAPHPGRRHASGARRRPAAHAAGDRPGL